MTKRNVQPTSIEAYRKVRSNRAKLRATLQQIFDYIRFNPGSCNLDISTSLGIPINCVTPRVKELRTMGRVVMSFKAKSVISGHKAMHWRVASRYDFR